MELLRAQPICPHAGRIDDVVGADLEVAATLDVAYRNPAGTTVLLNQPGRLDPIGEDRSEALRLLQRRENQPGVVGLTVVEEISPRGVSGSESRSSFNHLGPIDHPMALRRPVSTELVLRLITLLASTAQTVDGHHVIKVEPHAEPAIGPLVVKCRNDHRQRLDQMRCQADHYLTLEQGFADEPQIELLQVAQTTVNELRRAARGARRKVGALDQRDRVAACCCVERYSGACDPAADHDDVESLRGENLDRFAAFNHRAAVSQAWRAGGAGLAR
ncbi:unannotated protein [freshwater metagenome]|uniref:Unannotated protein n=1 Tax=freshwater metagenome TaxID=449393 RepID=A0A6J5ZUK4_9ZZZZ